MIIKICSNKSLIYVKTHTKKRYKKVILNWGNLVVFNMVEMTKKGQNSHFPHYKGLFAVAN